MGGEQIGQKSKTDESPGREGERTSPLGFLVQIEEYFAEFREKLEWNPHIPRTKIVVHYRPYTGIDLPSCQKDQQQSQHEQRHGQLERGDRTKDAEAASQIRIAWRERSGCAMVSSVMVAEEVIVGTIESEK